MFVSQAGVSPSRRSEESPARWMRVAAGRIGVLEDLRKQQGEVAVQRSLESAGLTLGAGDPWCVAFVRWVMGQIGYPGSRGLDARAWLGWGERASARYGAVAVFADSDPDGPGHVGFYVGESRRCVYVLGGNTWFRGRYAPGVGIRAYNKARLLGYRWPAEARRARARRVVSRLRLAGRARTRASASAARRDSLPSGNRGDRLREPQAQIRQNAPQTLIGVLRQLV